MLQLRCGRQDGSGDVGGIGLEDDALATAQGKVYLAVSDGGSGDVAVQRLVERGRLEVDCQGQVGLHVVGCQVGNEVVVACVVAAADGLEAILRLHHFWLGGTGQFCGLDVVKDVGTLCLEVGNMLLHLVGHVATARDDEAAIARACCRL